MMMDHAISKHSPSQNRYFEGKGIYCAARNYLTLIAKRQNRDANWHLEGIGKALDLAVLGRRFPVH